MPTPYLASPARTMAVLEKFHSGAKKKFGQNFLIDGNILHGIVAGSGVTKEDVVLEIGPGIGTLTQYLSEAAAQVIAVEIDHALLPVLKDTLGDFKNTEVVSGDFLKMDVAALKNKYAPDRPFKVVANLPYYITTPVLFKLLEAGRLISGITVMVQTEVARRMETGPGSKDYGALSLAVQYYAKPKILFDVSPGCFLPVPKVGSSVICLEPYPVPPVEVADADFMFRLIRASFNQRRKTLVNSLKGDASLGLAREQVEEALQRMNIDLRVRGETFSLDQFATISNLLRLDKEA